MPQRRRYATRDELVALILGQAPGLDDAAGVVVDELAKLGVEVDQLVKIEVAEDI